MKEQHPNAKFFNKVPSCEKKKFDRRNDANNKKRAKRIDLENSLIDEYLKVTKSNNE